MSDFDELDLDDVPSEERSTQATEAISLTARKKMREQLQRDIEEFMKRGGQVQQIEDNVRADPPRKPAMDYGSSPI